MAERAHPELIGFKSSFFGFKKTEYRKFLENRYKFCKLFIKNKTVIDVPCGVGWGTSLLKGAKNITGIDISEEAIQYAQEKYSKKKINFLVADMIDIPLDDSSCDIVICLEGYGHVSQEVGVKFLEEAIRVLRPDGLLIMTAPIVSNRKTTNSPHCLHKPSREGIYNLMGENFIIQEFEIINGPEGDVARFVVSNMKKLKVGIEKFLARCSDKEIIGSYKMHPNGQTTLYSSCFAVMCFHYLGELEKMNAERKEEWAKYINSFQDEKTGLFFGPEIINEKLESKNHNFEHIVMHLAALVLPSLDLLDAKTRYPLSFAYKYLDKKYLEDWLNKRDWSKAWLEGNNLLFVGQFLVYLRDQEQKVEAREAINLYFDWLDKELDPKTGLWGTNGYCSNFVAMCGGYHQLLMYYYEKRPVLYQERLIDTVLSLQHPDGGFSPSGGGGACEDVDAADILVNMYKRVDYRRSDIKKSLSRLFQSIIKKQMPDGGFVYRHNQPFVHMGILKTRSPINTSNMFATWFRLHAIALIAEILSDAPVGKMKFQFNNICSMGWHRR